MFLYSIASSNGDLQTLGKAIGVKWDRLARRLPKIEEDDIEEIEDSYRTLSQRGFHMLKLWKRTMWKLKTIRLYMMH